MGWQDHYRLNHQRKENATFRDSIFSLKISKMPKTPEPPFVVNSICELHNLLSLPKPEHPLVSVVNIKNIKPSGKSGLVLNFYSIWLEKNVESKVRYGQTYFDFDEGSMIFLSPGQVVAGEGHETTEYGWGVIFHPDFIKHYPLAKIIKDYGYFSYSVHEALHLSEKEETMIAAIMQNIKLEYSSIIDHYSQDVIISQIETLLNYLYFVRLKVGNKNR
jgi:AraC family transcriptional activator of pobA